MPKCIDLRRRFGDCFRVVHEEDLHKRTPRARRKNDPWRLVVACRHGEIHPHGGELLGASTARSGAIAKRLAALACVRVAQDGADGINVVFHVSDIDQVAAILKPRRRRKLTPEQIAERTERLRTYQFPPATQNDLDGRRRDPSPDNAPKAA